MTKKEFASYSFRHSEIIIYHQPRPREDIEMLLIGVDFDNLMLHLYPVDVEWYEEESMWMPIEMCDKKRAWDMKQKRVFINEKTKQHVEMRERIEDEGYTPF